HQIIHENIRRSALFGGLVEGVGPRYCPSIEDKLVKFSDKERHQLFIEPESASIDRVYLQGFSTSMPHEVQELMVHSLPGLSQARIAKYAYAIEYDAIDPTSLKPTLESKIIHRLFFAGQVNGTSGYEEAAAQGLMAGINAYLLLEGRPHFVLRRDEAYIGVLIDDLVTKGTKEPYRMLTSRAEFRLLLRHDNADLRLSEHGYRIGLLPTERYMRFTKKKAAIEAEYRRLRTTFITPSEAIRNRFADLDIPVIKAKTSLTDVLKRPDIDHEAMRKLFPEHFTESAEIYEQIEIEVKYEGYIQKAIRETEKLKKEELIALPEDIDYHKITNLALEARSKLQAIRPLTIGQASRISGVNPADIQTLLIYLRSRN
ncbi:MAG: tRNA uridine-5-carboxymethylaminomethyl(34) synthesis enzyme MnmG, partial [Candidatus Izemoplasmatales bacterium]|nr:tRNA uridine-5-carboxymethylaminomethyl(34) synthesis enzyme MnmG [Candidatus Izemoplasmatales bacterium]